MRSNSFRKGTSKIRTELLKNFFVVAFILFSIGLILIGRLVILSADQEPTKSKTAKIKNIKNLEFKGSILSSNLSVLSMSQVRYKLSMDMTQYQEDDFESQLKSLSRDLSSIVKNKSEDLYYKELIDAKSKQKQYHRLVSFLVDNITYNQIKDANPFFNLGRYKSGIIVEEVYERVYPFGNLAKTTIGYSDDKHKKIGIESAYEKYLLNLRYKMLQQNNLLQVKKPTNANEAGLWLFTTEFLRNNNKGVQDLVSTINSDLQELAQEELLKKLKQTKAQFGTLVLMEVKTGKIRALVNLNKINEKNEYSEYVDFAITKRFEPGSTMKLISYLIGFELGYFKLYERIDTGEEGYFQFKNAKIRESDKKAMGRITTEEAFERSSNIFISKLMLKHFDTPEKEKKFYQALKKLGLDKKLGMNIPFEATPEFHDYKSKKWSSYSKLWNSFGYEYSLSPLHLLAIYNAIANDGVMIKPQLIEAIQYLDTTVKVFPIEILNEELASKSTIKTLQSLLRGVVLNGTGQRINLSSISLAGKTGTSLVYNKAQKGYGTIDSRQYRASFCGYFPFEDPQYSMIVLISEPQEGSYYASEVAAPVFKSIAQKITAIQPSILAFKNQNKTNYLTQNDRPMREQLYIKSLIGNNPKLINHSDEPSFSKNRAPNLLGKSLEESVQILNKMGLIPSIKGEHGQVRYQNYRVNELISARKPFKITLKY